jgi:hypothetical protein
MNKTVEIGHLVKHGEDVDVQPGGHSMKLFNPDGKKFTVYVEEHLNKAIVVTAENEEEAVEMVRAAYKRASIVLTSDDYSCTQISTDTTEWEDM